MLGQAYVAAHHLVVANRAAVEHVADAVLERKELFGDELLGSAQRAEDQGAGDRLQRRGGLAGALLRGVEPEPAGASQRPRGHRRERRAPQSTRSSTPSPAQRDRGRGARRPSEPTRSGVAGYRSRFAVVYVVLALLAGAAVGRVRRARRRPDPGPPPAWSAWEPTGSDAAKAKQIADRVAKRVPPRRRPAARGRTRRARRRSAAEPRSGRSRCARSRFAPTRPPGSPRRTTSTSSTRSPT